ncbi:hypothetical protein BX600DRAFT_321525 [Xylariales sp. PMI_506]|nr:hypothetical protein BX600DRAFT_321525 [Xylariales sp. PMI_506]
MQDKPPAATFQSTTGQRGLATGGITDALLYSRFPKAASSHDEVMDWLSLMVRFRGWHDSDLPQEKPESGLRYVVGSDLHRLSREEIRSILPDEWPDKLRLLIASDVKRFCSRRQDAIALRFIIGAVLAIPTVFLILWLAGVDLTGGQKECCSCVVL